MGDEKPTTERDVPPSLDDLDARLRDARARRPGRKEEDKPREGGLSFAFRIGVELVAAVAVGVGIGLLLDAWLGTKPWMLVLFFILGCAAGMLNIFRTLSGYGYSVGYRKPTEKRERSKDQ